MSTSERDARASSRATRALPFVVDCFDSTAAPITSIFAALGMLRLKEFGGMTPLMISAGRGECDKLQSMLDRGANVNKKNDCGSTALMVAAWYGQTHAVRLLLNAPRVDPNTADNDGYTAMMMVLLGTCNERTFHLLHDAPGINMYACNNKGATVYDMADSRGFYIPKDGPVTAA